MFIFLPTLVFLTFKNYVGINTAVVVDIGVNISVPIYINYTMSFWGRYWYRVARWFFRTRFLTSRFLTLTGIGVIVNGFFLSLLPFCPTCEH